MILAIEALLQDMQVVIPLPITVWLDKMPSHHSGQRSQMLSMLQVAQDTERYPQQHLFEPTG